MKKNDCHIFTLTLQVRDNMRNVLLTSTIYQWDAVLEGCRLLGLPTEHKIRVRVVSLSDACTNVVDVRASYPPHVQVVLDVSEEEPRLPHHHGVSLDLRKRLLREGDLGARTVGAIRPPHVELPKVIAHHILQFFLQQVHVHIEWHNVHFALRNGEWIMEGHIHTS